MKIIQALMNFLREPEPPPTGDPRIYYWMSSPRDWRWNLRAANHEVMASGEGYTTKQGVIRGIDTVKKAMAIADVMER